MWTNLEKRVIEHVAQQHERRGAVRFEYARKFPVPSVEVPFRGAEPSLLPGTGFAPAALISLLAADYWDLKLSGRRPGADGMLSRKRFEVRLGS